MRLRRQLDRDRIPRAHRAARDDDRHHPRLQDDPIPRPALDRRHLQPRLPAIELETGRAQPGQLDDRGIAEPQPRARRQRQQVDPRGGDILPHLARRHGKALGGELGEQFGRDEMHLPEVGHLDGRAEARAVAARGTGVAVAVDAISRY